jgi:hypothetical protein
MSMDGRLRFEAALLRRRGHDADAAQIADAVVELWTQIGDALGPIIGRGGVDALFQRCLHRTAEEYPWARELLGGGERNPIDAPTLKAVFARQTPAEAAAGGGALFHQFHALLASLIGSALTERLLHEVHARLLGEGPSQDL